MMVLAHEGLREQRRMSWYDRWPLPIISLLTVVVWNLGGALLVNVFTDRPASLLQVFLVTCFAVAFTVRERRARRRAGLAL